MDLKINNLEIELGAKEIIKGIDMSVNNKDFVALLGPNGSGKSTLLKAVYRLLKPTAGTILLDDKSIEKINSKALAREMSVVSQFHSSNFDFSVQEVVMMGRTPHLKALEQESEWDYKLVENALRDTGLITYKKQPVSLLSGGEKQRVALARAMVQSPSIMILDEPSNHLDVKYQLEILNIIKGLEINVLSALHDITLAAQFCDYIYFIKEGKIVTHGKPRDVINKAILKQVYEVDCEVIEDGQTGNILVSYYKPQ